MSIDNTDDIIDSRDVIERIEELEALEEECASAYHDASRSGASDAELAEVQTELDPDEAAELRALRALAEEGENLSDWTYGEALIRDSYFEDYARQLADDIGVDLTTASWPLTHIDWEAAADALKMDYTEIDFDGVTYWGRS